MTEYNDIMIDVIIFFRANLHHMNTIKLSLLSLPMVMLSVSSAFAIQGIYFEHQNWEISCDNTGACQAAGYQNTDSELPASILLIRQAGKQQAISGEFALATYDLKDKITHPILLFINQQSFGEVKVTADHEDLLMGTISNVQVQAILKNVKQKQEIQFRSGQNIWRISDQGMTATLLKMDDVQKRIGTIGAIVNKGTISEQNVLQPSAIPVVKKVKVAEDQFSVIQPDELSYKLLANNLVNSLKDQDDCPIVVNDGERNMDRQEPLKIYPLNESKVLVSTLCWRGAYNESYGYWLMNKDLTGQIQPITTQGSNFYQGEISAGHKGRGIGDCWSIAAWVWDGKKFIQTEDSWTGMCKGIAAGGVWDLKKITTNVLE